MSRHEFTPYPIPKYYRPTVGIKCSSELMINEKWQC